MAIVWNLSMNKCYLHLDSLSNWVAKAVAVAVTEPEPNQILKKNQSSDILAAIDIQRSTNELN